MLAYIDEIRKVNFLHRNELFVHNWFQILETMPQTNEVLEFTQLIGPFYEFVDDRTEGNGPVSSIKKKSHHTNGNRKKQNVFEPYLNGTGEGKIKLKKWI